MVNKMDLKSGLVVPFYVTVETHGTEGQVLNVEDKVKEVKEDIVVALGLSRSLVTGDGPNFATASVSLQKMLVMIREIKQAPGSSQLDIQRLAGAQGWEDKTLQFLFNDLDPSDAVDFKRLLIGLYDRKLISRSSLQLKMDLDLTSSRQPGDREALGGSARRKADQAHRRYGDRRDHGRGDGAGDARPRPGEEPGWEPRRSIVGRTVRPRKHRRRL